MKAFIKHPYTKMYHTLNNNKKIQKNKQHKIRISES